MACTPITYPRNPRTTPFDPPEVFGLLRAEGSLTPMTFVDGHVGWLATGYDACRAIFADPRFSNRRELAHLALGHSIAEDLAGQPAEPGMFLRMDPPDHTRYRKMLITQFTARRIKELEDWIEQIVVERLDVVEEEGPGVDLVEHFATPIPLLVICELLGIPYEDRHDFQLAVDAAVDTTRSKDELEQAMGTMYAFFPPLIAAKRSQPTDDFFSDLVNAGDLTDQELSSIGLSLFAAGFETTANQLGLGTFALLQHPDQMEKLRREPELMNNAVDELLRYLTITHLGPQRTALEDVEVDGHLVRKGQSVLMSLPAANRDPKRFDDPDALDLTRAAHGHLVFGHGIHRCIGEQLARSELRLAFAGLLKRFPTMRLAVPADQVSMKNNAAVYGVHRLPVSW
ncbi:cytochrome P450 [Rhodococcus sp. NPDC055024]